MIKLIVSDIDGTLLKNHTDGISQDFFNIFKKFKEKGVAFAAASGRMHSSLSWLFNKINNDMYFISSNGATIRFKNEYILRNFIPFNLVRDISEKIQKENKFELLIATEEISYILCKDDFLENLIHKQSGNRAHVQRINSVSDVKDRDIVKLSMFDRNGIKDSNFSDILSFSKGELKGALSSEFCFDLMNSNVNKGNAIEVLSKKLNINSDEVVVFGDNFNDIEMLSMFKNSYAMETAENKVKSSAKFICNRVEDTLEEIYNKYFS